MGYKIDTATKAPYSWGRFVFRFNWAEFGRCDFVYTAKVYGLKIRVCGDARHSLASDFREQWDAGDLNPESPFIRYFFQDVPHALEAWQHVCRVAKTSQES